MAQLVSHTSYISFANPTLYCGRDNAKLPQPYGPYCVEQRAKTHEYEGKKTGFFITT